MAERGTGTREETYGRIFLWRGSCAYLLGLSRSKPSRSRLISYTHVAYGYWCRDIEADFRVGRFQRSNHLAGVSPPRKNESQIAGRFGQRLEQLIGLRRDLNFLNTLDRGRAIDSMHTFQRPRRGIGIIMTPAAFGSRTIAEMF